MLLRPISVIFAFVLVVPAFAITALSVDDPSLQGTSLAAETFTIFAQDSGDIVPPPVPLFFVDERIVQNAAGTLDFYFKVRNAGDPQPLREFALVYPNSIQASVFYIDEGNLAPTNGVLSPFGNQSFAGYYFGDDPISGPLVGADGSDTLLLRTDTNSFSSGSISVTRNIDDFVVAPVTGLVPSVPEPDGLAIFSVGIIALAMRFWRHDRSKI